MWRVVRLFENAFECSCSRWRVCLSLRLGFVGTLKEEKSMGVGGGRDGEVHLQRYWYGGRRSNDGTMCHLCKMMVLEMK